MTAPAPSLRSHRTEFLQAKNQQTNVSNGTLSNAQLHRFSHILTPEPYISSLLTDEDRKILFYRMLQAREFDMAMIRLYRQGRAFGGVYSQIGNEATSVGSASALESFDAYFPMHRNVGGHFTRGQQLRSILKNFLAREGSMMRGTDGTGHYADVEKKVFGNVSHLGAMIPVAAGYAMASKMRGENLVAMTYIGDGGAQTGEFHEGVNFAAVQKIPLIVVIENNQYAYSSPNSVEFACEQLSDRAIGYGCTGVTIDGTDVELVYETCKRAIDHARLTGTPALIECITMRMRGHAEHDDFSYVPRELLEYWQQRDPIDRYAQLMEKRGLYSQEEILQLRQSIADEMHATIDEVVALPFPRPEEARRYVFVE
ncbi:MAG: thiamine pyrophosphate-dependent dehydrogenase E1 component subunit alpha [Bacteroidota bacterium]|nr:thiamine pyrophosphate-dependent dehydrogenase E1 component subunit alpha [Candidatus Kapabacteria bacterium]MDW8220607.1 thiamine pyrophosphate-dependent dehydrogenase E1 component subunit alpha [Bacteroidota bacterium]